ncbi:unnamed protein product [Nesidiocoris tenuis]|uniref:Chorein N-terminal domain-containing protein n=1 Tax=Nesidiocoris tenuis TaxID=355587 RepID=A0A6H5GPZ2_9HEMI|nr:unnamed protein product [Nesidiocoris tenuis]
MGELLRKLLELRWWRTLALEPLWWWRRWGRDFLSRASGLPGQGSSFVLQGQRWQARPDLGNKEDPTGNGSCKITRAFEDFAVLSQQATMFERALATILHRYLGKYIQDIDTENLNVGIFGGEVQLNDLKVKPDAFVSFYDKNDAPESPNFFENLITTIMNNLQIFVHNIHFRYEDSVMNQTPFACGICLQGISVETTNSKWKPTTISQPSSSVYQMVKFESVSIYCNPVCRELVGKDPEQDSAAPYTWRTDMKRGLETFSVRGEDFDFILKPITAKMKLIVNKSNEVRVPKLLVDFVLQDAATQLSRLQYLALIELMESFKRINSGTFNSSSSMFFQHAISELMSFFQLGDMTVVQIISAASDRLSAFAADFIIRSIKRFNATDLNVDIKLPYAIIPELGTLQKHKLNVTLASLKINVSDRKIGSVMDFLDNLPLPSVNTVHVSVSSNIASLAAIPDFENDQIPGDIPHSELFRLKILCVETLLDKVNKPLLPKMNKDAAKMAMLTVDK